MTRRRVALILALALSAWLLTGCGPRGSSCPHPGDQMFKYPDHYTCTPGPDGTNTWQKMAAYDLGVGTWRNAGHGHSG